MTQRDLGYETAYEKAGGVIPYDPKVETIEEKVRLSKQCVKVLALLRIGPVTNQELSSVSLQYCTPIRQLRLAGYRIPKPEMDHTTGVSIYHLEEA